jgi:hypothetical protein
MNRVANLEEFGFVLGLTIVAIALTRRGRKLR